MSTRPKIEEIKTVDPFDVSLELVQSLSNDEYNSLVKRLYDKHGDWIRGKLQETNAGLMVVCARRVIHTSEDEYDLSANEVAKEHEQKVGKPCYIIGRQPLIEEQADWSDLGERSYLRDRDFYPTIEIRLGREGWDEEKLFKEGISISCDFDTGNANTSAFNEDICRDIVDEPGMRMSKPHLTRMYIYNVRNMKVGIEDGRKRRSLTKPVEGVEDWENSDNPLKQINPQREGFVGRDLMLQLLIKVILDPKQHISQWELL